MADDLPEPDQPKPADEQSEPDQPKLTETTDTLFNVYRAWIAKQNVVVASPPPPTTRGGTPQNVAVITNLRRFTELLEHVLDNTNIPLKVYVYGSIFLRGEKDFNAIVDAVKGRRDVVVIATNSRQCKLGHKDRVMTIKYRPVPARSIHTCDSIRGDNPHLILVLDSSSMPKEFWRDFLVPIMQSGRLILLESWVELLDPRLECFERVVDPPLEDASSCSGQSLKGGGNPVVRACLLASMVLDAVAVSV